MFGVGCAGLGQLRDSGVTEAQKVGEAIKTVRLAAELGINYFDTSPLYKLGKSEYYLGLGLKELVPEVRKKLCISTKVGTHRKRSKQYDRDAVLWSFEESLKQLHCDTVEIVYVHDPENDDHMNTVLGPSSIQNGCPLAVFISTSTSRRRPSFFSFLPMASRSLGWT